MRRLSLVAVLLTLAVTRGGAQAPPQQTGGTKVPPPQQTQSQPPATDQPPAEQPARPTFRAGIDFVRVDVIVTNKKGEPVVDLKPEEVEVFEDGARQDVESFKLFKVDEISETTPARPIRSLFDEESEAQRPDVRLFAFFLDDYHVRRGNAMRSRIDLADFVRRAIAPQDMVGMMYPLTPTADVVMGRNHEALARALEQFDGRKYDYVPRNEFEERYANYPAEIVEQVRNQVSLGAIKGLILKLGGLREGRKALILVSEGYTNYLPAQLRSPNAAMPGVGNPIAGQEGYGDNMREQRERFFSQAEMLGDLKDVYDLANKNNVSIYALDPRGLAVFEHDINEAVPVTMDANMLRLTMDSIRVLADETDGRAIVNRNDLAAGMRQIIRDSSAYYLVGYNSKKAPTDGRFHEIKVRVKRPGVEVRHRKGYWALTPDETAMAVAPPKPIVPKDVDTALGALQTAPRGQYISSWVGLSRGQNGKTKVTFVWEPAANTRTRGELPARVHLTVVGADGAPYFRGATPESASANPAARGPQRLTFEVPPGRVQVKYAIRDATETTLDTDIREFSIPDLAAPQVGLSTPGVLRARTPAETQAILKDPNAVPVVAREFRRTERLIVRTQAYGPGTEVPVVTAKLLNRIGSPMQDLPVTQDQATGTAQLDLPLAGVAPGEYLIDLRATGQGGEAKQLVAFKNRVVAKQVNDGSLVAVGVEGSAGHSQTALAGPAAPAMAGASATACTPRRPGTARPLRPCGEPRRAGLTRASRARANRPSSGVTTELLFLLDELAQGSRDTLLMLASTDPQVALRRTAAEQPEAYALALALREHYSGWLRERQLETATAIRARYDRVRLQLLSAIVEGSPDGRRASDARYLAGVIAFEQNDLPEAERWWRRMRPVPGDSYSAASAEVLEALQLPEQERAAGIARVLGAEHRRWLDFSEQRLRQFGHAVDRF